MVVPAGGLWRRVAFEEHSLDDLVTVCQALNASHPVGVAHDEAMLRRLLTSLTSSPEGVFVVACDERTKVVATVVDRIHNGRGLANLAILGCAEDFPGERLASLVLQPAAAFAARRGRRTLQVEWTPAIAQLTETLEAEGFRHAYDMCTMQRPLAPVSLGAQPALPRGFAWASLDVARIPDAHGLLLEAFDTSSSAFVPPLDEYTRAVRASLSGWQLLLDGSQIAGLVRVQAAGPTGELRTVARRPAYRGRGIGRLLVDRGLRQLAPFASTATLQVEARNTRATALYSSFGFAVVERLPWFERELQGSCHTVLNSPALP